MALGRGLGAILEEVGEAYANEMMTTEDIASSDIQDLVAELELSLIDPNPYQPRKHFDEQKLQELSDSIKNHGLLQPVVVVSMDERYILVAGERRLRAHKLAKLETIKAIVASVDFDEIKMRELALIENIQRENLNPIELAHSYQELIAVHKITHDDLAKVVHKSRSQITNTMRLLSLGSYASEALIDQKITQGHAKILVGLEEAKQKIAVDTIIGQKLSVREAEILVKSGKNSSTFIAKQASKTFKIENAQKEKIDASLPFKHKIKQHTVEIVLPNEEEVIKFISFLENK
jgi:ParB family chromosome partitioning protein